ncbi:MAG: hypothetical protein ABW169_09475 [Sphingobium sp.]
MQGFLTRLFRVRSQADYAAVLHDRDVCRANYEDIQVQLWSKTEEARQERETTGRILRDKIAVASEAKMLRVLLKEARTEIAELKPDAEAHRARLSRDRDYHRAKRSAKTPAAHFQPASPAMSEGFGGH